MAQAYGLYSHIQTNRLRSVLLVVGLILLLSVLTFGVSLLLMAFYSNKNFAGIWADSYMLARNSMPYVAVATLAWVTFCYYRHERIIDAVTHSREVTRSDEPRLFNLLENLCISRGMKMPRLGVMESPVRNAFASGMNERQHRITVTRGLMEALNDQELEAVLAHELTHIRNGDINVMVIAALVAGIITFVGEFFFRIIAEGPSLPRRSSSSSWSSSSDSSSDDGKTVGAMLLAIAVALLIIATVWFLSMCLRFALSRSREYLADAGAVELTKNPDAMISALDKINGHAEIPHVPSGIMEMCIENHKSGPADLFASHPDIADRIDALVRYAGGTYRPR